MKRRSKLAAVLILALLAPQLASIAAAAAPQPSTDEAVYVTLDEYGATNTTRIVKGVYLNGSTSISDYGDYSAVYNMTSLDKPTLRADGVDFKLKDPDSQRFYYECIPSDPSSLQMPWTFDISYKLDGVPAKAEDLAGVSGLVEINIHAIPNPNADEYYRNNMTLIVGTGIDMSKTKSLEAPGAQLQSLGSYKLAVFLGLPGEEDTYTIRIGSDSFEFMGIYMLMAPGTVSQLDTISDFRDARDKLKDAHNDLYQGISDLLDTIDGMQGGAGSMSNGIADLDEVRRELIASRGTLDPDLDQALNTLDALAGDSESLIPELDTAQKNLNAIHSAATSMLSTLTASQEDIADYQKLLKDLKQNLANIEDMLDDIDDVTGSDWLYLKDIRKALNDLQQDNKDLKNDLEELQSALSIVRRIETVLTDLLEVLGKLPGDKLQASVAQLLKELRAIGDASENTIESLRSLMDGMNSLLGSGESTVQQLEKLNDVLDDYRGVGQDAASIGQQAASLASKTLDRVNTLLTQTGTLQSSLNQANTSANTMIPKVKTTMTSLTGTLKSANTLLADTRDTLRSLRDKSDSSTQTAVDGLLDVLQRASSSTGTTNSLQQATDSIHNTISDEVDDLDSDSNVLNMDNSLALRSVTSDRNASPSSLQFILRTDDISVDKMAEAQADAAKEDDVGVLGRIVNVFKTLFHALATAFSSDS